MKAVLTLGFLCTLFNLSLAQTSFQKKLDAFMHSPLIRVTPGGDYVYIADVFTVNSVNRIHIYQLDGLGNIQWHLMQISSDLNLKLVALSAVEDGVVVLLNAYYNAEQSNAYLLKVNLGGSVIWSRRIGDTNHTQLFDIQEDNENNLWLSGLHTATAATDSSYYFLMKMDDNGVPVGSKQNYFRYFSHSGYEKCKYTDLSWNNNSNLLVYVQDFETPYSVSYISQPNRGRLTLGYCDPNFNFDDKFLSYQISTLESANTSLFFSGWTIKDNFQRDKLVIGILDTESKQARKVKFTPSLYRPIHSYSDDIVYYVEQDKTIIKMDDSLTPVWSIKLDNCSKTNAFQADIAQDGSIFSVRNIDQRTIVAKSLQDGTLPACISYRETSPVLTTHSMEEWYGYNPTGYPNTTVLTTLHTFGFTLETPESQDFCVKLDASFEVPDTICLGTELIPTGVDTMEGLRHTWDIGSLRSEDSIPEFSLQPTGVFQIFHTLENNICLDTASRKIRVIQRPAISFQDTLVCGPASLTLDFNNSGANRYYLNDQSTDPVIRIEETGIYTIRLENNACFAERDIRVKIVEFEPPVVPLDSIFCFGAPVEVRLSPDFDQYVWDQKPVLDSFVLLIGGQHMFQARYKPDTSCVVGGIYDILRKKCGPNQHLIYAPNVFAPDTQFFQLFPTSNAQIRSIQIFNRWGSLVYQNTGESPEWNGTFNGQRAAPGVYAFWIEYLDKRDESIRIQTGDVLLLK